ncbi:MAG TPA: folylpolyglutamate synthase/dihydrofolate synthase family protein [Opitutaceae bacterium]|nr:folylpolyglutamate synthase/dihydrofolate synthase family protein [Opitutaceae bacterium]
MDPAAYASIQDYLFSLKAGGARFGIDRMQVLAEALGHPERAVPVIHVAGTNGKGSTSAMLEAVFRAAGWRTGLYTSPHLVRLGERVQVDRQPLTEAEIVAYTDELKPVAEKVSRFSPDDHPSFFEFMTAMAFLQFQRRACDIAIVEVGLGGRLDATNVVAPEISVITSIGLDHCEYLGNTQEQIAAEKAGIIKPGRPVVIGRLRPAAENVIRQIAAQRRSRVISVVEEFDRDLARYPVTNLEGDYQRWNAATATLVARLLPSRWKLTDEALARGLNAVDWPGRWQRLALDGRRLILDTSHNPEGAGVLRQNLERLVAAEGAPIVVVGVLGAARARPLLETIATYAREIHLVVPNQSRSCSQDELAALLPPTFKGTVRRSTVAELFPSATTCAAGKTGDTVVVTGSVYLIGEVLERIEPGRGAGEGKLQDF